MPRGRTNPAVRTQTTLEIDSIHYILMKRNYAEVHAQWGETYRVRVTMAELEKLLGDRFVKVHRSCLVCADQVHYISDRIYLKSGESVKFVFQKKQEVAARLCAVLGCTPASIVRKCPRPVGHKTRSAKTPAPPEPEAASAEEEEEELPIEQELTEKKYLPVLVNRRTQLIDIDTILYIRSQKGISEIHSVGGETWKTRTAMSVLEEALGEAFLRVNRGCLVSAMAIRSITKKIVLINGEELDYARHSKRELRQLLAARQKWFIDSLSDESTPATEQAYREYYQSFDALPFAFADIEMVFNEENRAVDWIFRYGNPALARLEKMPLRKLIGRSFGSIFANMDAKWLRAYEQAVLYGKTLEIIDYSPEIDTNLKVICFPTFRGHCGCILFDIDRIELSQVGSSFQQALLRYLGQAPDPAE